MIMVVVLGFSRKRTGRDGKPRYTAYYLDIRDQERSAGTFGRKKDAEDAWKNHRNRYLSSWSRMGWGHGLDGGQKAESFAGHAW